MTYTYFSLFPTISYSNTEVRDISKRVVLDEGLRRIPTAFYPYDITNNMRSDVLAYTYYNDPDADWLIYLTNGIVDPYYGWYLTEAQFDLFITKKYGDLETPQQVIDHWTTNWSEEDVNVTVSYYDRLNVSAQKYWIPVWGAKNKIIAYKRRPEDWIMNTNKILNVTVANTSPFVVNDLVQAWHSGEIVGTGQITNIDTTNSILKVKNPLNDWNTGDSISLRNGTTLYTMTTVATLQTNITNDEMVYWQPITQYEMENQKNEINKTIQLVDPSYLLDAWRSMQTLLKG